MTFYQLVEDIGRKMMEWAQSKQYPPQLLVDEIKEKLVTRNLREDAILKELRSERLRRALS